MPAKAQWVASVGQGAAVAAIEPRQKSARLRGLRFTPRSALLLIFVFPVLLAAFQNCSVELSSSTPGASTWSSCGDLNLATLSETDLNSLIASYSGAPHAAFRAQCLSCHAPAVSLGAFALIAGQDGTGTLTALEAKSNICSLGRVHKKFRDRGGDAGAGLESWLRTDSHKGASGVTDISAANAGVKSLLCFSRQSFGITGPPPAPDLCQ
jgi:hypothetical protein